MEMCKKVRKVITVSKKNVEQKKKRFLLMRTRYTGPFSNFDPVKVEPLDLEYLAGVLNLEGHEYRIYDTIVRDISAEKAIREYNPDVVGITGYVNGKDVIIEYARAAKKFNKDITVLVGGVHAEMNYGDFYHPEVDIIVQSGGFQTFRKLIKNDLNPEKCRSIKGTCMRDQSGEWKFNGRVALDMNDMIFPDRSHFYRHKDAFTYLYYGPTAMVKSAYGCPYRCNFCYCKFLNDNKYSARPIEEVVDEIAGIDCDTIWLVDDTFLIDKKRLLAMRDLLRKRDIKKKFIVYGRADFIAKNEPFMPVLREIGIIDVIVGLEAIDTDQLENYDKAYTARENEECARILRKEGINLTGLFIAGTDSTVDDFRRLKNWIYREKIMNFTVSIFTPVPGTPEFDSYKDKLITTDYRKWDFIHHVIEPTKLGQTRFFIEIYLLYLRHFLINSRLRKYYFHDAIKKIRSLFSLKTRQSQN